MPPTPPEERRGRAVIIAFPTVEGKEKFRTQLSLLRRIEGRTGYELLLEMVENRCRELGVSNIAARMVELEIEARLRIAKKRRTT